MVVDAPQASRVDVAVDLRRRERRVAEQLLDRPQVCASLEQVRREGVTEAVGVPEESPEHARVEALPADGEEERVACPAHERGPAVA